MKLKAVAAAVAGLLAAGTANAAFVYVDSGAPPRTAVTVPPNNNFFTQLTAAGVSQVFIGTSLGLSQGGRIHVDYFGKEAMFTNSFQWAGATIRSTPDAQVDPWSQRFVATFSNVAAGVLDFAFCTSGGPAAHGGPLGAGCVTNVGADTLTLTSLRSIGMHVSADGRTAWLIWDDGGAGPDDNHDDMIVRLRYEVPEPATLGLFGLGLLGAGVAARRRKA